MKSDDVKWAIQRTYLKIDTEIPQKKNCYSNKAKTMAWTASISITWYRHRGRGGYSLPQCYGGKRFQPVQIHFRSSMYTLYASKVIG
jgi:hypothetical protein